jgi:hypothetical protein
MNGDIVGDLLMARSAHCLHEYHHDCEREYSREDVPVVEDNAAESVRDVACDVGELWRRRLWFRVLADNPERPQSDIIDRIWKRDPFPLG